MNVYDTSTMTPQISTNSVRFGGRFLSITTICYDIPGTTI